MKTKTLALASVLAVMGTASFAETTLDTWGFYAGTSNLQSGERVEQSCDMGFHVLPDNRFLEVNDGEYVKDETDAGFERYYIIDDHNISMNVGSGFFDLVLNGNINNNSITIDTVIIQDSETSDIMDQLNPSDQGLVFEFHRMAECDLSPEKLVDLNFWFDESDDLVKYNNIELGDGFGSIALSFDEPRTSAMWEDDSTIDGDIVDVTYNKEDMLIRVTIEENEYVSQVRILRVNINTPTIDYVGFEYYVNGEKQSEYINLEEPLETYY